MNERKVPRIRFKGFEDDWEQRKLGDIAVRETATAVSSADNPCVEYEDVVPEEGRLGKDIYQKDVSKKGIAFDGTQVLYGKLRPYLHNWLNPDFSGVAVGDWWVLKPNAIDKNFLFRLMQTQQFDDIANQSSGSKMPRADWGLVSNAIFTIPTSSDEQEKIAKTFTNLDHLITLHQRELDKLKTVKKSMLENCFPKNGEKVPKFRFSGFTDDWEQRKLGDFGSVAMCKRIFKDQTSESGDIPFYKIGTFGGEPDAYISRDLFEEYKHLYSYPEKGDILISASGSIGRTVEYTGEDAYYQDSNIVWLKHDKTIVNSFLKHLYEVIRWSGIEGSTIKRLYNDNILKTEVRIPSAPEQEEIGKYLNNIDHLITLHQRKLDKLHKIKKSMLQYMFV
ncbi:MAG: restriction endonuclease subunit S [Eubacterium sp.]